MAFGIFQAAGFVLVADVLSAKQCRGVLRSCEALAEQIVGPMRLGNRGLGRYSFGKASSSGSPGRPIVREIHRNPSKIQRKSMEIPCERPRERLRELRILHDETMTSVLLNHGTKTCGVPADQLSTLFRGFSAY